MDELRVFLRAMGVISEWVFPAEEDPGTPMDRFLFEKWLLAAEEAVKLSKLDGGLWHPYRRKWASERKHLPLRDVAAAGGWVEGQHDPVEVLSTPRY
jgi:hypothetical protein